MISDLHRCIFIHVPKCAGESIETVFLGRPFNVSKYEGHPEKHWGVREISRAYPVQYATYFRFSVVRNPWDRVISWVRYRDIRWSRTTGSFEERLWADLNDDHFVRFMLAHTCDSLLFLDGRLGVDRVLRLENLQPGFDEVCDLLDMPRVELPHRNRTEHAHYSAYYDRASRLKVAELFEKDIREFDYSFQSA